MKPCKNNRKRIAWLVVRDLCVREEQQLRAHLETCAGCRGYLEEMSSVTEKLTATEVVPDIRASDAFHQQLVRRLKAQERVSFWSIVAARLQAASSKWQVALPAIGATAILVTAFFIVARPPTSSSPQASPGQAITGMPATKRDLAPTISNYQMIANRSLEKLDELLTTEGNRSSPSAPLYTASSLAHAVVSD